MRGMMLFYLPPGRIAAAAALGLALAGAAAAFFAPRAAAEDLPRYNSEYELAGGALLPSKIPLVTEVMPVWDLRATRRTKRGIFEGDVAFANSSGVSYDSLSLEYRYDLANDALPAFVLLGAQGDFYKGLGAGSYKAGGGWNFGGGGFLQLAGPLWLRGEFRYRFSPGTSILFLVGLSLRLSE
jgi:hypothetical protein